MTRTYLSAGSIAALRRSRPAPPAPPGRRARPAPWWPLPAVLAVQAALSLRLVWSATAFQDEALYLRAGHLEWAHWLHQAPVPGFPAYFSGAPVLYPPLAAAADSLGGLAAARLLSLCFMLGVTSLLWASTARLYGRRAALLASGLFATGAGTQFLGAFATFDAMALFLLALATWLAVRAAVQAGGGRSRSRAALLATAGLALAAAGAVAYPTVLFTPVVLAVAALAARREQPGRAWLAALVTAGGSWLALAGAALAAGGRAYWRGGTPRTPAPPPPRGAVSTVLRSAYIWTSLILVLAVLGAAIALAGRAESRGRTLPAVLAAAALLAPAGQAVLHTTVSLHKHVVPGAWFAAIAAGYAMARLSRVDPGYGWAAVMALPIAAATLFGSLGQAGTLFRTWPDSAAAVAVLRSAVRAHPGQYLAEDYDVEAYYLGDQVPWPRWSDTWYFRYGQAAPGAPSYAAAISRHYFSLVILEFGDTAAADVLITADMRRAGGYYVLARTGPFTVWAARAPALAGGDRGRH